MPEAKTVKNRLHLDINASKRAKDPYSEEQNRQHVDAEVERLKGLGAREIYRCEQHGEFWVTLADPENNEFCVQ